MSQLSDDAEPIRSPLPEDPNSPPYRFRVTDAGAHGARVASIAGDLDYLVTPALRRRLLEELPAARRLVLDLAEVTLLSAAALEMLVDLDQMSVSHGAEVRIVATTRAALRPLQLTGLDRRLRLYPTVRAALERAALEQD